jgi:sec-independent protein translocase protein TatA
VFGNIGLPELIIIFVIILLLFGGKKLPEVGQNLGKAIKSFKDGISGDAEKKSDAEPAAPDLSQSKGELPREADAAPAVHAAEKDKAREPARKG